RLDAGCADLLPNRIEWKAAAKQIPRVCRHQTTGPNHPSHLGDAFCRITNEEDDECHDGGIEPMASEGERHGVAPQKRRAGRTRPCASNSELFFLRIDALGLDWSASLKHQFGEGTCATSYIEPPQADWCREPIDERVSRQKAPRTHGPLVGVPVLETDRPIACNGFVPNAHHPTLVPH